MGGAGSAFHAINPAAPAAPASPPVAAAAAAGATPAVYRVKVHPADENIPITEFAESVIKGEWVVGKDPLCTKDFRLISASSSRDGEITLRFRSDGLEYPIVNNKLVACRVSGDADPYHFCVWLEDRIGKKKKKKKGNKKKTRAASEDSCEARASSEGKPTDHSSSAEEIENTIPDDHVSTSSGSDDHVASGNNKPSTYAAVVRSNHRGAAPSAAPDQQDLMLKLLQDNLHTRREAMALHSEIARLREENCAMADAHSQKTTEALLTAHKRLEEEKDRRISAESKVASLASQNQILKESHRSSEAMRRSLASQRKVLEKECSDMRSAARISETSARKIRETNTDLREKLEAARGALARERSEFSSRISELEAEKKSAEEEKEDLALELARLRASVGESQRKDMADLIEQAESLRDARVFQSVLVDQASEYLRSMVALLRHLQKGSYEHIRAENVLELSHAIPRVNGGEEEAGAGASENKTAVSPKARGGKRSKKKKKGKKKKRNRTSRGDDHHITDPVQQSEKRVSNFVSDILRAVAPEARQSLGDTLSALEIEIRAQAYSSAHRIRVDNDRLRRVLKGIEEHLIPPDVEYPSHSFLDRVLYYRARSRGLALMCFCQKIVTGAQRWYTICDENKQDVTSSVMMTFIRDQVEKVKPGSNIWSVFKDSDQDPERLELMAVVIARVRQKFKAHKIGLSLKEESLHRMGLSGATARVRQFFTAGDDTEEASGGHDEDTDDEIDEIDSDNDDEIDEIDSDNDDCAGAALSVNETKLDPSRVTFCKTTAAKTRVVESFTVHDVLKVTGSPEHKQEFVQKARNIGLISGPFTEKKYAAAAATVLEALRKKKENVSPSC